jgi:hypothetical protein
MVAMKPKLPWLLAGFLGILVVLLHAQNSQPANGSPARFQLLSADRETAQGNHSPAVFRLDTQTGETTIYREGYLPANSQQYRYNYWQRVDDRWLVHDQAEETRQALSSPR